MVETELSSSETLCLDFWFCAIKLNDIFEFFFIFAPLENDSQLQIKLRRLPGVQRVYLADHVDERALELILHILAKALERSSHR
jgi:hypothetical protein